MRGPPVSTCQAGDKALKGNRKNGNFKVKQKNCSLLAPDVRLLTHTVPGCLRPRNGNSMCPGTLSLGRWRLGALFQAAVEGGKGMRCTGGCLLLSPASCVA